MKHTELKAFVKKYNSEFIIKGYSKMKMDAVTAKLKKSRQEIKKEWESMHTEKKAAIKPETSARDRARNKIAARYGKSSAGQGSYLKGKASAKPKPKKKPVKQKAQDKADDAYHAQHKGDSSVSSNATRMVLKAAGSALRREQRAKIQKDMKLTRRIISTRTWALRSYVTSF